MRTQDTFLHTSNCVAHVKTAAIFIPAGMEITAVLYFRGKYVGVTRPTDAQDDAKKKENRVFQPGFFCFTINISNIP